MPERGRKSEPSKRKRSGSLTEQDVIDTALRTLRRNGNGQLSMRALAKELGVTPMALCHYVPSKEALLDRLRDSVLAMVPRVTRAKHVMKRMPETPLNPARIVDTALHVIRRGGVDALTMRAVAERLGVSAMALYYHVPDKEALLDRVREAVLAQVPTPPPRGEDWEAQLKAYALAGIRLLASYPGLLHYGATRPPTKGDIRLTGYGIGVLLAAGFDERSAALAITTYHVFIIGTLLLRQRSKQDRGSRASQRSASPLTGVAAVAQHLRELDELESIEYGIDIVIDGLRLRLTKPRSAAR